MGSKWREPQLTPDWTDVAMLMKAIEALHGVMLFITTSAGVFDGPASITTVAAFKCDQRGEASVLGSPVLALSGEWPCPQHKDWYACVMSALYSMDTELGRKLWGQSKLPFTVEGPAD